MLIISITVILYTHTLHTTLTHYSTQNLPKYYSISFCTEWFKNNNYNWTLVNGTYEYNWTLCSILTFMPNKQCGKDRFVCDSKNNAFWENSPDYTIVFLFCIYPRGCSIIWSSVIYLPLFNG